MNCNEIRELLSPYIDSFLEDEQVEEVNNHLTSCVSCRKIYDELQDITLLLSQSVDLEVPATVEARLRESINLVKNDGPQRINKDTFTRKRYRWRMVSSIAAIFAVGILTYGVYNEIIGPFSDSLMGTDQLGGTYIEEHAQQKETLLTDSKADEIYNRNSSAVIQDNSIANIENKATDNLENLEADSQRKSLDINDYTAETKENVDVSLRVVESDAMIEHESLDGGTEDTLKSQGQVEDNSILSDSNPDLQPSNDSNSISSQEVQQNTAANHFYSQLIRERLVPYNYQIIEQSYVLEGEWLFKVFIFTDQDGNTYNNEILITGKDGEIYIQNNENMRL